MNDTVHPPPTPEPAQGSDAERTKQVTIAGWTAGASAFFAVCALVGSPTWPTAIGIVAVTAMVAVVCYFILRKG